VERLLLAVDESPNGKFAARLAGLLAGTRGISTTVLPLEPQTPAKKKSDRKDKEGDQADAAAPAQKSADVVKAAAAGTREPDEDETPPSKVEVTVRKHEMPAEEAVATEAKKGYDLLFVGVGNTRTKSGSFHRDVTRIVSAFEGPTALVAAGNLHLKAPQDGPLNILVPVAGTDVSRRAAEVAIAIARAGNCPITGLYVAPAQAGNGRKRRGNFRARREEQAVIKEIAEMADRYGVAIETEIHADTTPDEAILAQAKEGEHNLIVMGVSRRAGDALYYGDTAAAVFERAPASIVFVSS
jgi:nucleotide-binding universal stress UspA family protein